MAAFKSILAGTAAVTLASLASLACTAPTLEDPGFDRPMRAGDPDESPGGTIGGDAKPAPSEGIDEACASSTAKAEQLPLHMVVVLDKSGSMCEYTQNTNPRDCKNANSKWQQVTKALGTFFASPQSKGITVSLVAFPLNNGTCNASTYASPLRADVALPDTAGVLASDIGKLSGDGSTPTRPALEGAINYAKTVEAKLAGKGKVAVVMATDGYPQDCSNNSIGAAANVASSVKDSIPTYVIGVGDLLNNLNSLAAAGGTSQAFLVSTSNSQNVGQSFADALTKIRGASLSCEYGLPAPPAGQTLDL